MPLWFSTFSDPFQELRGDSGRPATDWTRSFRAPGSSGVGPEYTSGKGAVAKALHLNSITNQLLKGFLLHPLPLPHGLSSGGPVLFCMELLFKIFILETGVSLHRLGWTDLNSRTL